MVYKYISIQFEHSVNTQHAKTYARGLLASLLC